MSKEEEESQKNGSCRTELPSTSLPWPLLRLKEKFANFAAYHEKLSQELKEKGVETPLSLIEIFWSKYKEMNRQYFDMYRQLIPRARAQLEAALPEPMVRRLHRMGPKWERVLDIYRRDYSFEWDVLKLSATFTFWMGFFLGGMLTQYEASRRFDLYAEGKRFQGPGYHLQRKTDYMLIRFFRGGWLPAMYLSAAISFIMGSMFVVTAYRDHYSPLYFPVASGKRSFCGVDGAVRPRSRLRSHATLLFALFRSPVCSLLALVALFATKATLKGYGPIALRAAFLSTLIPNVGFTGITCAACAYYRCWPDEGFRRLRDWYREEEMRDQAEQRELRMYIEDKQYSFVPYWWAKRSMNREKELGTWQQDVDLFALIKGELAAREAARNSAADSEPPVVAGDDF